MKKLGIILVILLALPFSSSAVITTAHLTEGASTSTTATITTSSTTPTANALVVVTLGTTDETFTIPTLTGNGMTWVVLATSTAGATYRFTSFRSLSASPSAGTLLVDYGANPQSRIIWMIDEFIGVDTSGSNGSGAVVQTSSTFVDSGGTQFPKVVLQTFATSGNAAFGAIIGADQTLDTAITPGNQLTEISELEWGTSDINMQTEWSSSTPSTSTVDWQFNQTLDGAAGIAIEIRQAPTATVAVATLRRRSSSIFIE